MSEPTDSKPVRAIRDGSSKAADVLFERHWRGAWQAAYAVLGDRSAADDAAQRAIERSMRSLEQFREGADFGPWLRRIAVNQAIDLLRRGIREEERPSGSPRRTPTRKSASARPS